MKIISMPQVSISSTFYEQHLCTKVFCTALLCLQFEFIIFCQKEIGTKAARELLVKLNSVVDNTIETSGSKGKSVPIDRITLLPSYQKVLLEKIEQKIQFELQNNENFSQVF